MANNKETHTISVTMPIDIYDQLHVIAVDEVRSDSNVARKLIEAGLEAKYK